MDGAITVNNDSIDTTHQPLLTKDHSDISYIEASDRLINIYTKASNGLINILNEAVPRTSEDTNKSWAITLFGRLQNHLGMWGQGIFGGLLIATIAKKIENQTAYYWTASVGGAVVGYGAFKGKDLLMWFFGEQNWRKLGEQRCYEILFGLFNFWQWRWDRTNKEEKHGIFKVADHLFGIIARVQTMIMGIGFGLLVRVSLSKKFGAGMFAEELGSPTVANVFDHYALQAPLMASSANSNFLGGPNILEYGVKDLTTIIKDFFKIFTDSSNEDNEKVRAVLQQFTFIVNRIRTLDVKDKAPERLLLEKELKAMVKSFDLPKAPYREDSIPVDDYPPPYKGICDHYDYLKKNQQTKKSAGFFQKALSWFVGTTNTALTCWGLQNFLSMPDVILKTFIDNPENYTHITTPLGIAWFISMVLLSCSVYQPSKKTISQLLFNNGDPKLNYTSSQRKYWNCLFGFILCAVGSTPNIFQHLLSTHASSTTVRDWIDLALAAFASFMLEFPAVLFRYFRNDRTQALKTAEKSNDKDAKLLLMADSIMTFFDKAAQPNPTHNKYQSIEYMNNKKSEYMSSLRLSA